MELPGIKSYEEVRKRLLEEGSRSYLDAVTALLEYRKDVQTTCRTVLERRFGDYIAALDVHLEKRRN